MTNFSDPSFKLFGPVAVVALPLLLGACASLQLPGSEAAEAEVVNPCTRALRDQRVFCRSTNKHDSTRNLYRCLEARRRTEQACRTSN